MSDVHSSKEKVSALLTEDGRPFCEEVCRYGIPCTNPAKWVTPKTKRWPGGRKVCGVHKHRGEDFLHRCKPL